MKKKSENVNVLLHIPTPNNYTTNRKSNVKQKLQTCQT